MTDSISPLLDKHEKYLTIELNIKTSDNKKNILNNLLDNMYGLKVYKKLNTVRLRKSNGIGSLFTFTKTPIKGKINIITQNELFLSLQ